MSKWFSHRLQGQFCISHNLYIGHIVQVLYLCCFVQMQGNFILGNFVSGFMILFNLYPLNKLSGSSTCLKYSSWRFVVLDHLHSLMNKSNPCQHIKSNKRFSKLIYTQITIHFIHTCTHIFTVPLSVSLANAKISWTSQSSPQYLRSEREKNRLSKSCLFYVSFRETLMFHHRQ